MATPLQASRDVLQHFLVGFDGTSPPAELRALLAGGLGGVAIYPRNFSCSEGLRVLRDEIRAAAAAPVLIGIDQEGGTRFSLPEPFTQWPSPEEFGAARDADAAERLAELAARAMAAELLAAGVNLNFAPMLDLHVHPESPVTQVRSYGSDPLRVAELGAASVRGHTRAGVLCCAKHFPGHGDAVVDPHAGLPVFHGDEARLEAMELAPFAAAFAAGVPCVMTAHILLPKVDPAHPATLSRKVLHEILRKRMGFRGAILADDLGMGAIRGRLGVSEAAVGTLVAGSDIAMLCHDRSLVAPAIAAVAQARAQGVFDETEWQASAARLAALRELAARADANSREVSLEVVGCAEHRGLVESIRRKLQA